ncbi:MAG: site-2 protease family protein [Bordetella sp.]|uniref:site-2 protease family protein n=1 Tax=Bordetella sp. TaxID=28081 RepID=UPI003F7BF285
MGISIDLDYSWFVVFALLTWALATGYFPAGYGQSSQLLYWAAGAATAVMMFVCVLLHELGHAAVALRYKIPVRGITLFIFGGVAQIGAEPPGALAEFFIAIAGPLVSLVLAILFYVAQPLFAGMEPLLGIVGYLAYVNVALVLFNLIPGYPLDGGRVLRAIVWKLTGSLQRATLIAANAGRIFGLLLIFLGVMQILSGNPGGIWIAFVGWFLDSTAHAQVTQVRMKDLMAGYRVTQAMNAHCAAVSSDMTLQELVNGLVLGKGQRSFLVEHGGQMVGLATLHQIRAIPRHQWAQTRVDQAMLALEKAKCIDADAELWSALETMDRNGVNQLPVTRERRVVGMLSRDDIITFLRTIFELKA